MRNRLLVTLVLGLSAALLAGPLAPVAVAAPAAPTGLSPDGSSVSSNPVLSWTAVPKATSYRVELSRSGTFDTIDYSVSTVNRQATPTIALPRASCSGGSAPPTRPAPSARGLPHPSP